MNNTHWNERQQNRIRDEFGEEPREVVRVMHHDQRVPLCHVAEALYVSEATLRKWCKEWDLPTLRAGYIPTKPRGKVERRAIELGYPSIGAAITALRQTKQWNEVKEILQCGDATMCRHLLDGARGYHHVSDRGREIKRETMRKLNAAGKGGKMPSLSYVVPLGYAQ